MLTGRCDAGVGAPFSIFGPIVIVEEYANNGSLLESHGDQLMNYVKSTLEAGKRAMGTDYARAMSKLWKFRARMEDFFEEYDLLLTPTTAVPAYPIGARTPGDCRAGGQQAVGSSAFHCEFQHSRKPRGQCALRILVEWTADRAAGGGEMG